MTHPFERVTAGVLLLAVSSMGGAGGCGGAGGGPSGMGGAREIGGGPGAGGAAGLVGAAGRGGISGASGVAGASGAAGPGGAGGTAGASGANGVAGAGGTSGGGVGAAGAGGGATCGSCAAYGTPMRTGQTPTGLDNLSGMTASWGNPGVLFAHNDMTQAIVYALATDGRLLARFALPSAGAVDIEDIAVGPCPAGTCVFLADIGGNLSASRVEFAIYRIAEPAVPAGGTTATTNVSFERFRFAYPDGANHNAESLLVDPATGALYIITKVAAGQPSTAYALPTAPSTSAANTLRKVAELPVPRSGDSPATAASAHPCGLGFLLRTNGIAYEFRIAAGAPFESAFAASPVVVPTGTEPQSEAIAYRADGRGYFTSGETAAAPIFAVGCQ
jgi:hypothetical protein